MNIKSFQEVFQTNAELIPFMCSYHLKILLRQLKVVILSFSDIFLIDNGPIADSSKVLLWKRRWSLEKAASADTGDDLAAVASRHKGWPVLAMLSAAPAIGKREQERRAAASELARANGGAAPAIARGGLGAAEALPWAAPEDEGWAEALLQRVQSLAANFVTGLDVADQLPTTLRGLISWHRWFLARFEAFRAIPTEAYVMQLIPEIATEIGCATTLTDADVMAEFQKAIIAAEEAAPAPPRTGVLRAQRGTATL